MEKKDQCGCEDIATTSLKANLAFYTVSIDCDFLF
jgi:hypothetical protein